MKALYFDCGRGVFSSHGLVVVGKHGGSGFGCCDFFGSLLVLVGFTESYFYFHPYLGK